MGAFATQSQKRVEPDLTDSKAAKLTQAVPTQMAKAKTPKRSLNAIPVKGSSVGSGA